jgi:hypothetical protein
MVAGPPVAVKVCVELPALAVAVNVADSPWQIEVPEAVMTGTLGEEVLMLICAVAVAVQPLAAVPVTV